GFWGHIHIADYQQSRSWSEVHPLSTEQKFYPSIVETGPIRYIDNDPIWGQTEKMTKGGVRHIQTYILYSGIISAKDEIEGIVLKGIGEDFDWSYLQRYLQAGEPLHLSDSTEDKGILLSEFTANRLRVDIGDKIDIFFVTSAYEELQRRFTVKGLYKTGLEEYDREFAIVDMRRLQQILRWQDGEVGGFEIFLDDIEDLEPFTEEIYFDLDRGLSAENIKERMRAIFEWLELQDVNEWVIMGLMLIVAIINMVTALLILILERTNMIGTLKSLGAGNWAIRKVFLYYAGYIVVVGLFWGNLIGLGLCWLQDTFGFVTLDEANYYLSVAPIKVQWMTILLLNLGTLLVTLLFLIVPSYLVSRVEPVKAIRFK
ncbi:MAG: FtsX-like permease family protein, partial [Bacteroidota bacterium]